MVLPTIFKNSSRKKSDDDGPTPPRPPQHEHLRSSAPASPEKPSTATRQSARSSTAKERHRRPGSGTSPTKRSTFSSRSSASQDRDTHPLNLPPEERRKLSARMAESVPNTPMDVDREATASPAPASPSPKANGAPETNGDKPAPTPPPHKTPAPPTPQDAESFKAAGNKFFKAKDYANAIKEYSKGAYQIDSALISSPFFWPSIIFPAHRQLQFRISLLIYCWSQSLRNLFCNVKHAADSPPQQSRPTPSLQPTGPTAPLL